MNVEAILDGWTGVKATNHGPFWSVSGTFKGQSHAGTGQDPEQVARNLVARLDPEEAPVEPEVVEELVRQDDEIERLKAEIADKDAKLAEAEAIFAEQEAEEAHSDEPPAEIADLMWEGKPHGEEAARLIDLLKEQRHLLMMNQPYNKTLLSTLERHEGWLNRSIEVI